MSKTAMPVTGVSLAAEAHRTWNNVDVDPITLRVIGGALDSMASSAGVAQLGRKVSSSAAVWFWLSVEAGSDDVAVVHAPRANRRNAREDRNMVTGRRQGPPMEQPRSSRETQMGSSKLRHGAGLATRLNPPAMLRARGNRLSTATRPLTPRGGDVYGARGTRKMQIAPPQYVGAAPVAEPRLSLEELAQLRMALLRVELEKGVISPDERAKVLAQHGLDVASERLESAAWSARFRADRFVFADYMQLFTSLRAREDEAETVAKRLSAARAAEKARAPVPAPPFQG